MLQYVTPETLTAFFGRKSTQRFVTICVIEFYDWGRGVVPTRKTAGLLLLFCVISRSVSRPAEVRPWEVRFAHPCRARARHPIHKAMGGHASHGRTSVRASIRPLYPSFLCQSGVSAPPSALSWDLDGAETITGYSVVIGTFVYMDSHKVKSLVLYEKSIDKW